MVELEHCLLVGDSSHVWSGQFFTAKESNPAALEFLVDRRVTEFVIVAVGEAIFLNSQGNKMVGRQLHREVFSKHRNFRAASLGCQGVMVGPEFMAKALEKIGQSLRGKGRCECQFAE